MKDLQLLSVGLICAGLAGAGCSSVPGNSKQQGAVVGGATGAAVGAAVTKNRALGAVIGGAVGAAGGYVVGGKTGNLDKGGDKDNTHSTLPPDTVEHATTGASADSNKDGFVTLDEIADMEKNGISDDEMIRRMQVTGLTFDLNDEQRKFLSDRGVSQYVIDRLPDLNRGTTTTTTSSPASSGSAVISR